ncbi:MAG: hypothetical protein KC656_17185, partial [Myxococcales bacterium]|nr:hypothetical protein [Myxococcales bacterium]
GNTASGPGGAVWAHAATVSISESVFRANTATDGGAVYLDTVDLTADALVFEGNIALGDGGGLYAAGGTLDATDVVVIAGSAVRGGGLAFAGASVTLAGLDVSGSSADAGGGLWVSAGDAAVDGVLQSTTADDGAAIAVVGAVVDLDVEVLGTTSARGALFVDGGDVHVAAGTFEQNLATLAGGAAWVGGGGLLGLGSAVELVDDHSLGDGGGIACVSASVDTSAGLVDNVADGDGGGIHADGCDLVLAGSLTGNTAAADGGGVASVSSDMALGGAVLSGNLATSGGAVRAVDGSLSILDATFAGNRATRGAALDVEGVDPTVSVVSFVDHTPTDGALSALDALVVLEDVVFLRNEVALELRLSDATLADCDFGDGLDANGLDIAWGVQEVQLGQGLQTFACGPSTCP